MKKALILLIFCLTAQYGLSRSTKGKEFWIGFMENLTLSSNGKPVFKLHINADITTTCTLSVPFTGFTSTFIVNSNQVYVFTLPAGIFYPAGDEAISNVGIKVASNDLIEVKAFHHRFYFTESTIILPLEEISDEYMIVAQDDLRGNFPSELVVLATQNNTTIDIVPSVVTIGIRPAGLSFSVTLQQGQMYQLQSYLDLSGTVIKARANKKVAVFGGALQAMVGCVTSDNHVYDQVYPITSLGTNYHVIPFLGHSYDLVKVLASQNSTTVSVSNGALYNLSRGEFTVFSISNPCEISSNNPIAVTQLATGQACSGTGDEGMINLTPIEMTTKKAVFYTLPSLRVGGLPDFFPSHILNIVIKNSAIGNLKIDNNIMPANWFTPVSVNSNYSYVRLYRDTMNILNHILVCDSGFSATLYSLQQYNFYGHHLGYDRPDIPTVNTGLSDRSAVAFLDVFPIPGEKTLTIRCSEMVKSIEITDHLGNAISSIRYEPEKEVIIDIENLSSGVYYCTLQFENTQLSPKVVKFVKTRKE